MSLMISALMPGIAAPLTAAVTATQAREEKFAGNLAAARTSYETADQAGGEAIRTVSDTQMAPSTAAAAGGGGQFGQMMSTAMQMASQAAQVPAQVMGMAAQAPQAVMQAGQGAVQQIGQMAGQFGKADGEGAQNAQGGGSPANPVEGGGQDEQPQPEQAPERKEDENDERDEQSGAAPGPTTSERAPEGAAPEPVSPGTNYPVASDPIDL